ncbi:MAG: class I SAM-dependent methyltransferase [Candidatus Magasanikbacteria bacterium]|nr:class I SAM-dependent methyltransferase [Candidatus Magasanikbacteria bacterium]
MQYQILEVNPVSGYELLDSGDGEKLERYGDVVVVRPDPQALWRKKLPESEWQKANAYFKPRITINHKGLWQTRVQGERDSKSAEWQTRSEIPARWPIEFGGLKFWIKLSAFKHTGLFPEQLPNWVWLQEKIRLARPHPRPTSLRRSRCGRAALPFAKGMGSDTPSVATEGEGGGLARVLNLFGYTGGATLACAQAGASVVHVDASKSAIGWGRDNAVLSGLDKKPIRWILDDAATFVRREIKRGNKYDGIIMDPPAFGHGPNRELWKIEDHFLPLLEDCKKILSREPLFFLVNGYASGYSAVAYENSLGDLLKHTPRPPLVRGGGEKDNLGNIEIGELTIAESGSGRILPAGIFARWSAPQ